MRLDNIRLLCANFDATFTFYRDTLGLPLTWGEAGGAYASFDAGGQGLALFQRTLMAQTLGVSGEVDGAPLHATLVFEVQNLDERVRELQGNGVAFLTTPRDMADWGIRVAHLRDPEGNLIELFTPLRRDAWSEGLQRETDAEATKRRTS